MAVRACALFCSSSLLLTDKSAEAAAVVYFLSHKRIVQPLPLRRPGPSTRKNHCTTKRMRVVPHPPGVYPTSTSRDVSDQAFPAFNCSLTHNNAAHNAHVSGEAWERGYVVHYNDILSLPKHTEHNWSLYSNGQSSHIYTTLIGQK